MTKPDLQGLPWSDNMSAAPSHQEVLVYSRNEGVLLAIYTNLAEGILSERQAEEIDLTEDELFRDCWWSFSQDGLSRLEDDMIAPTHWMRLPFGPDELEEIERQEHEREQYEHERAQEERAEMGRHFREHPHG